LNSIYNSINNAMTLSTPSLGITVFEKSVIRLTNLTDFQLPLSGSLHAKEEYGWDTTGYLSTPSLGITEEQAARSVKAQLDATFNSLSRDHPLALHAAGRRGELSTPSLGIT
jgi:hypothetical protein